MRSGGGKAKGSAFERWVCKQLSLWVTHGNATDVFWRSAMSGGRATVARRKKVNVRQAGDICAVAPEGNTFVEDWYVECKTYKNLQIGQFMFRKTGVLFKFWEHTINEAKKYDRKPMLIVKQNGWPVLVLTNPEHLSGYTEPQIRADCRACNISLFSDMLLAQY